MLKDFISGTWDYRWRPDHHTIPTRVLDVSCAFNAFLGGLSGSPKDCGQFRGGVDRGVDNRIKLLFTGCIKFTHAPKRDKTVKSLGFIRVYVFSESLQIQLLIRCQHEWHQGEDTPEWFPIHLNQLNFLIPLCHLSAFVLYACVLEETLRESFLHYHSVIHEVYEIIQVEYGEPCGSVDGKRVGRHVSTL